MGGQATTSPYDSPAYNPPTPRAVGVLELVLLEPFQSADPSSRRRVRARLIDFVPIRRPLKRLACETSFTSSASSVIESADTSSGWRVKTHQANRFALPRPAAECPPYSMAIL